MQLLNLCSVLLLQSDLLVGLGSSASVSQVGSSVASIVILSCELQYRLLVCSVRCDFSVHVSVWQSGCVVLCVR